MKVKYTINDEVKEFDIKEGEVLLDVLRRYGYTEVKGNCYMGTCGACAVLVNGTPRTSCTTLAAQVDGATITTVKGIGTITNPSPLQTAFVEKGAVQCGFCTPGTIVSAYALLQKNLNPTEEEIKKSIDGNLCRCTGYVQQIEAIKYAAQLMKGGKKDE
jgi:aerobic-type carbon monoxide dehydrogenase small subunit (CoxS/CutS family)